MISSVGQNNNVQRFSAVNALRANAKPTRPEKPENEGMPQEEQASEKTGAKKSLLEKVNTDEIRQYATYVGEFDISDEDIRYGLLYGRSVIAEYLA